MGRVITDHSFTYSWAFLRLGSKSALVETVRFKIIIISPPKYMCIHYNSFFQLFLHYQDIHNKMLLKNEKKGIFSPPLPGFHSCLLSLILRGLRLQNFRVSQYQPWLSCNPQRIFIWCLRSISAPVGPIRPMKSLV